MSVRQTNQFWSVLLELTLFFDFLNIFVKMRLVVSFAGKKIVFFGPMDQKLRTFEVCPYTWEGEIFPPSWSMENFIFFKFFFSKFRVNLDIHIHRWDFSFMKK
jgi:hypothetical protein